MNRLFRKLPHNFIASFTGYNFLLHLTAIGATYLLVISGFDWFYFISTQIPILQKILFPAVIIGGRLPLVAPVVVYVVGKVLKKPRVNLAALALGQAVILGFTISTLYKAFTGRLQPDLYNTLTDISHAFQFGFWRHGVFWGWPSSHTTIAFAMAFSIFYLFRKNKFIFYAALVYALYIGLGISISIHWFSEFVAGALIGSAIGLAVGKSFSEYNVTE